MNPIVSLTIATTLSMSSREIAELTGKRHNNVCRDIFSMITALKPELNEFLGSYKDARGRLLPLYNLPKLETLILVSDYSVELRAPMIDRWMELEAQALSLSRPYRSNPAMTAHAWAEHFVAKQTDQTQAEVRGSFSAEKFEAAIE